MPFLLALRVSTMAGHFQASGVEPSELEHLSAVDTGSNAPRSSSTPGSALGLYTVTKGGRERQLIQIAPELQGRGIGEALLTGLIGEARAAAAQLSLHVLHANPARRLYERLGFRIARDGEHEYLMRLRP